MEWLVYLVIGTLVLAAVLGLFLGVFETLKDITEFNDSKMIAVVKAASFIVGIVLASIGWLPVAAGALPFCGELLTVVVILATVTVGVLLMEFADS